MSTTTAAVHEPQLRGQTVVLIGGSAGIGLETARLARAEGAEVVLVGRNGLGKTTLLKALLAETEGTDLSGAEIERGTVRWGHETSIGYFPQDHTGEIQKGMTEFIDFLHSLDRIKQKFPAEQVLYTKLLEEVDPKLVKWKSSTEVK